jgi:hypothetical protein
MKLEKSEEFFYDSNLHDTPLRVRTVKQMQQLLYNEKNYEKKLIKKLNRMVK